MKPQTSIQFFTLLCATLLIVACGGGGYGGSNVAGIDRTGTQGFAIAFGSVTGFGSIIVNGVRYDTSSSSYTIDGQPGTESDIEVGDIVLVQGTLAAGGATGTATTVSFDDNVEGPISSIDAATSTLIVLGQTVRVDADTSFDDSISPPSLAGLSVNDVIEVSGFVATNGDIRATRIEPKAPGGELEVTGLVSGHNAGTSTFMINALVVDYSSATLEDFASGIISDGDLVEAKGTTVGAGGELIAARVELKGGLAGNNNDHVEIEGLITRFASSSDFDVAGFPVTTTNQTSFEGGVIADLGLNIKVEVEGELNAAGVLVADKVDIRRARLVRIAAVVDSVDTANSSMVVLGITVNVDALTRMEDKTDADLRPFRLTDLNAGEFVEIRGSEDPAAAGEVLAGQLEREDPREISLQGFVEDPIANPSFTILGVTVDTTGAQFRDTDDSPLASNEFFNRLAVGDLVKADGTEVADTEIAADEVEFESE